MSPFSAVFSRGGAAIYWRPLSRQAYYGLLGPLMLSHPRVLASIHAGLLAVVVRQEAMRGLALWRYGRDARHALALLLAMDDDYRGALAQLDTLLAEHPLDESALILRDGLRAEMERQGGASRP